MRNEKMTASFITFKESPLSPWGTARPRSRAGGGGGTGLLSDATPRAQKSIFKKATKKQ